MARVDLNVHNVISVRVEKNNRTVTRTGRDFIVTNLFIKTDDDVIEVSLFSAKEVPFIGDFLTEDQKKQIADPKERWME